MKYQIIYADPPWSYKENWGNGAVHHHYASLTIADLKNMSVADIADDNCHLYLWVTNPFMQEGLDLVKAWGFEYKQLLTWVKTNRDGTTRMGLGYYFRGTTEHIIFAVKGKHPRINKSIKNIIFAEYSRHSRKPDVVRDIIVAHSGDRPRIELFAREATEGWDVWGNEVESQVELNDLVVKSVADSTDVSNPPQYSKGLQGASDGLRDDRRVGGKQVDKLISGSVPDDGVLTLAKFEEAIAYMQSDEYHQQWQDKARRQAYNQVFISKLAAYKLITESEYLWLYTRIEGSGYMMVSKTWWDKISKLEPKLKKLMVDDESYDFLFPKADDAVTDLVATDREASDV